MKKLSFADFIKLRRITFRGARPLEYALWKCVFECGDPEEVLDILACYQNEDGGFAHALEANSWNPDSSPYVTSMAIDVYINPMRHTFTNRDHPVLKGILKYFGSGEYATETGWLGINAVPTNNRYSHAPWFHYDASSEPAMLDPGVAIEFILKYAEKDSALYRKAQTIEEALPKEKPIPDLRGYDPAQFLCWLPMPTDIVDSPDSPFYPEYKDLVEAELNGIVDQLHAIEFLPVPGIDNQADWLDNRQIISCYPSTCGFFIMQIEILRKFGRLDFQLPIHRSDGEVSSCAISEN